MDPNKPNDQAKKDAEAKARAKAAARGARAVQDLDQRIADKLNNAAEETKSEEAQLSQLERDVLAKQQAKAASRSKPGAVAVGGGARTELESLDAAVSSKLQRNATEASAQLSSLEDAVESKVRRETTRSQIQDLEDAVTSKVRSESRGLVSEPSKVRPQLSSVQAQLSALESEARGKAGVSTTTKPGSVPVVPPSDKKHEIGALQETAPKLPGSLEHGRLSDIEHGAYGYGSNDGLAVAVAVEDEEEDTFIQPAIEFDPDAKPPMYRNRRFRLYSCLAFCVLIAVAVGASVGLVLGGGDDGPSVSPRERLGIREQVERIIGSDNMADPSYARALEWIIHEDPLALDPTEPNFMQRYFMAYFYYSTSVDKPWRNCNPPIDDETDFCVLEILSSIFPVGFTEKASTRWLTATNECTWAGAFCDDEQVISALELNGNELSGPFPTGIEHFPFLQSIAFAWGTLRGPLPTEMVNLKHLMNIELHYNELSGVIPPEWWGFRNLVRLNMGANKFTGPIPSEVGQLVDLKGMFLFENQFSGQLPDEIGDLRGLTYLRLSRNNLNGTIPTTIGNLASLEGLWLHRNQLTGPLPDNFDTMSTLADFRVHYNSLTGDLPDSLYSLERCFRVDLFNNNFTGTISPLIANMTGLYVFRVENNQLEGELPIEMGDMPVIETLQLQGNAFNGTMPEAVCNKTMEAAVSRLETIEADCAAVGDVPPEFDCPCCTLCCNPDGEQCVRTAGQA